MTEKFDLMVPIKLTHTYLGDIWVAVSADTKEEAIGFSTVSLMANTKS